MRGADTFTEGLFTLHKSFVRQDDGSQQVVFSFEISISVLFLLFFF